jgi:hypothetical protein
MGLHIFADEFGTMPSRDSDPPFVGVAVAIHEPLPGAWSRIGRRTPVAEALVKLNANVHATYVLPCEGYGSRLREKLEKMRTMARARRLLDGHNSDFFRGEYIQDRNYVWIQCMGQALAVALAQAAFAGSIDSIHFHVDRKTMQDDIKAVFLTALGNTLPNLGNLLQRHSDSGEARRVLAGIRACLERPTITERNPSGPQEVEFGFWLADRVAYFIGTDLRKSNAVSLKWLSALGQKAGCLDITPTLMRSLSRDTTERWKRDTGLPEPT